MTDVFAVERVGVELSTRDVIGAPKRTRVVGRLEPEQFEVPDPTRPEGTVVQVVQTGYAIGDRVLRPAMVGVAKGGGAAGAPPAGEGHIDKNA